MSNAIVWLLIFFMSAPAWGLSLLWEFKESGEVIEYQLPMEPIWEDQGSGMGLGLHMWLGPGGKPHGTRPDPVSPHARPPLNNGQNGVPVDIPPDDEPETPPEIAWDCNIVFVNQTQEEKNKYNVACLEIERIVPTDSFENSVLTHKSYTGITGYYGSSSTCNSAGELGNVGAALYANILQGDERYPSQTSVDNQMDLKIEMYRDTASNTIGYTSQSDDRIHVNRKYSDGYKPSSMASNAFHEWLHKMGYGHSSASTSCRPYSIPYALGTMIRNYASPMDDDYGY